MAATPSVGIAEAILPRLRDLLGVPRAIVNLFDLRAGEVEWLAAVGRRRFYRGPAVRYSLRLAGDLEALRRGEPQVVDVHSLPASSEAEALLASDVRAYMVVPMIARGELIGSVSFGGSPSDFSTEQISIAQEVAAQLAIVLEQARLHERITRQAEELELRVQERTAERSSADEVLRAALALIRPQAAARSIQILEPAPVGRYVTADRQRLQQVLLNLLSNAVKYNRQGGAVRVGCEDGSSGRLRFTVADTGGGIAPEMMNRLFRPFDRLGAEQTGIEGTGLGLALSLRLVEAMGGTLTARSTVGEGATFTVELFLADGQSLPAHAAAEIEAQTGAAASIRGTVLYIEDNLSNLRLLERIIARRSGVTLLSAMQGSRGLELACAHRPDLIILDLHLPDMPGADVLARLLADPTTKAIPVVILSADATPGQISRLLEQGARAYLTKPLDVRGLLSLIDDTLRNEKRS